MFSTARRSVYRKCGISPQRIAELERVALTTKAKASPLAELVFKRLASGQQSGGPLGANAITKALAERLKQTKALAAPPHAPIIIRLMQRAAGLN